MTGLHEQITIDGPAASGKSTVAKMLAGRLGAYYINTGEMYRAATWLAIESGVDPKSDGIDIIAILDKSGLSLRPKGEGKVIALYLNENIVKKNKIRSAAVTELVSYTAKIPEVRDWMVNRQRETRSFGLIVMEGRDIGTIVFPEARHKFFITASPEERARRRLAQHGEVHDDATFNSVVADIVERDKIDSTRKISPLVPAADSETIDTTNVSVSQVVDDMILIINKRRDAES